MTGIKQSEVASQSIDTTGKLIFKNSMLIIPLVLISLGYFIYVRKFELDEKRYAQIVQELKDKGQIRE